MKGLYKMCGSAIKNALTSFLYLWRSLAIPIIVCICACSALPSNVRIAAIFDREGDVKHELAFTAAVDNINNINNWLLPGIILEPEIIKIPVGDRHVIIL